MFSNYLKIALRQLLKNKVFSAINILGLSVGVACCAVLALYIQDEFSYEKQFPERDRIYRIVSSFTKDGKTDVFPRTSPPIARDLADILPEVDMSVRAVMFPDVEQHIVRYTENVFYEKKGLIVDSTFFRIFPYAFSQGDSQHALDKRSTVVITEKLARKIFSDKSPLDELIVISSGQTTDTLRITGVLAPSKFPSHLDAEFYVGMNSGGIGSFVQTQTTWAWNNFVGGYLLLKPGADITAVERKMNEELQRRAGTDLKSIGVTKTLSLQPLNDLRLYSDFSQAFGAMDKGTITYIYSLGAVGIFILIIACINFMNLTTARATQRASEVGVRKSLGAQRGTLIRQFLGESYVIVAAALVVSLFLVWLILPVINYLMQKDMHINLSNIFYLVTAMIGIGLITGLLAGSYPSFFLSRFAPATVLKNRNVAVSSSSLLRQGMVVFQFVIAITLISGILLMQKQLQFISGKALGFSNDDVLMIPMRSADESKHYLTLKSELLRINGVKHVSAASALPSTPMFQDNIFYPQGSSMEKGILTRVIDTDEDYFKLLKIDLLAGRELNAQTDTFRYRSLINRVIVNESALKAFNIPLETAVGSRIFRDNDNKAYAMEIVGVTRDFHQASLHQEIFPLMFNIPADRNGFTWVAVSLDGASYSNALQGVKSVWAKLIPDMPFESLLLADNVKKQYEDDDRIATMLTWSTVIAILISCLGLYGLSIFVAERRVKEIGIRKVLGASVTGIVSMLSLDFVKLVAIAFVVAVPISYYAMSQWLNTFAYKTEPGIIVFAAAGIIAVLIAVITIGFESLRAASGNPVKALRSE